ncbi:polysaccharide biosynthesis protein [Methanocorpusculum labreanum Z]|uniref:Polysaccharide biosynthesis protein n=1 Tax=Methanocorpusculum labreanum (strain ATCC 43576 / DSM 4855 / Z) TaxID=410358 RepID=A2SRV9_METLZ|nr:hypothetical protein [Methanocorpusculum labreanum]ABN07065.1 polysaccharide biosynthesis protein [Methanocorpusculum labreanum Z]
MSEKTLDIQFQKQLPKNLLSNLAYLTINLVIGLALVPFFLETLGESAYGLIPLATSFTSFITLFIDVVNEAISRYLTIDLQRGDRKKAVITFNTSLIGTLVILLIVTPIGLIFALLSPTIFNIGDTVATDVIWLFALVIISVLIRAWSSNFSVILFAYNRIDLKNHVNNTNLIAQIISVVLLFTLLEPTLPFVGLSYLIAACMALFLSIVFSRKICPFLNISITAFSLFHLKEILSTAFWLAILRMGVVLRNQAALIITNIVLGSIVATEFSLVLTWNTLIVGLLGLITTCFSPMIFSYRAKDNKESMVTFTAFSVKIVTLLTALLVGLVCVFSSQLMTIWVGQNYADLSLLVWITVIASIFMVQFSCCGSITAAYIRVRTPGLIYLVAGGFNVILALTLSLVFNMGIYGIALATTITTLITDGLFGPIYAAHILKAPLITFVKPAFPGYVALLILLVLGFLFMQVVSISGIVPTFLAGGSIATVYCVILWCAVLNKGERKNILRIFPPSLDRKLLWNNKRE